MFLVWEEEVKPLDKILGTAGWAVKPREEKRISGGASYSLEGESKPFKPPMEPGMEEKLTQIWKTLDDQTKATFGNDLGTFLDMVGSSKTMQGMYGAGPPIGGDLTSLMQQGQNLGGPTQGGMFGMSS